MDPYINREVSWLMFNRRVLEEAQDTRNPLLERLRFLSIFGSNLDEFFMVRIGGLRDQVLTGFGGADTLSGLTPAQQLDLALGIVHSIADDYQKTKKKNFAALGKAGVVRLNPSRLQGRQLAAVKKRYFHSVVPLITAVVVDLKHPFPFLPNGASFAAVRIKGKNSDKLGLILFADAAPKIIMMAEENLSFFLTEDAAVHFSADIFAKYDIAEQGIFRLTRNADIVLDDDSLPDGTDYRQAMAHILEKRKRLEPVRLQSSLPEDSKLTRMLAKRLELKHSQIFYETGPLNMSFVSPLIDAARTKGYTNLLYKDLNHVYVPSLRRGDSVIAQTRMRDHLIIHPYMDFDAVLALLREAAFDPSVAAIRQTLYRVSSQSEVVRYLAAAAQNGKDVTVVVELKARFDEESNLGWAAALEEAGCRVIYGTDGLKVHAKLLLVTRNTPKGPRHTAHISTGNYNEITTRVYSDVGLLTANSDIADDIILFFREIGAGSAAGPYKTVSVSPGGIRQTLCRLIDEEMESVRSGAIGHIIIKVNALSDKGMIDKLIEASRTDVKIDLIVRGICCLKAPIENNNIRVVSVVGRFLEHARIYWFSNSDALFISSADLMTRNLDSRMEVLCPVFDRRIAMQLKRMMMMQLCDTAKGRVMQPDGSYARVKADNGIGDSQMAQYVLCAEHDTSQQKRWFYKTGKNLRKTLGRAFVRIGRRMSRDL
jgi:polyphosphate kinase